jgi:hypothetical protein
VFSLDGESSEAELVDHLLAALDTDDSEPEFPTLSTLPTPACEFANFVKRAALAARPTHRRCVDFAASLGCEAVTRDGKVVATALQAAGAGRGRQRFFGVARQIVASTKREHLHRSLFQPWTYSDGRPSMRWDPVDDRRYALRADDPSDNTSIRTERGANRLAIEALPCFPTMPSGRTLRTTGFLERRRGSEETFRWALWSPASSLDTVRALVAHEALYAERPAADRLELMGVTVLLECRRVRKEDGYVNFTPSRTLVSIA